MNDWQKGFELERLKAFAGVFKERHKGLVFGAFGLTKERDVADYLSRGRAIWTGDPPQAVALFTILKSRSEQHDFAQRTFAIEPGSIVVKAFAALDAESAAKLLRAIIERSGERPLYVEVFEEDMIARAAVGAVGLDYVTTKISAGSEIKGVYTSERPPLPALPDCELAALRVLDPDFLTPDMHEAIKAELAGAAEFFAQHYSDYNKRKSWTSFALHGYSDDPTFIIKPAEMSKSWKEENAPLLNERVRWTKVADHFPHTVEVVETLHLPLDRVRFMRLRSKDGELSRHADITDREAGVQDGFVSRLHIPIITSDAVTFYGWSSRGEKIAINLPERALCYLDQRKPHAVKNTDPTLDRTHLVIDCFANASVRRLIEGAPALAIAV